MFVGRAVSEILRDYRGCGLPEGVKVEMKEEESKAVMTGSKVQEAIRLGESTRENAPKDPLLTMVQVGNSLGMWEKGSAWFPYLPRRSRRKWCPVWRLTFRRRIDVQGSPR